MRSRGSRETSAAGRRGSGGRKGSPDSAARRARTEGLSAASLGQATDFLRVLWSLAHALESRSKRMAKAIGVSGPQRFALRLLERVEGLSASDLAILMKLDPSTVTGILQRLSKRRLLDRKGDPLDGRRELLQLTPAGRRLGRSYSGTIEASVRRTLRSVTPEQLAGTRAVLGALIVELADQKIAS